MYMSPTYFFDIGLRSLMRNPFFNPAALSPRENEGEFRLLDGREALRVTLGPNMSIFCRPGRSVWRWQGTRTIPRQSPHPRRARSRLMREFSLFIRILCGGGDVLLNRVSTQDARRDILLTAGEGNAIEMIDLAALARSGAPPLLSLQPAYLCSSANLVIQSVPCDASTISWARAPYVYRARACPDDLATPAILCLTGRTSVCREQLSPGESRDFALGNVIATTANVTSKLRPANKCRREDATEALERRPAPETEAAIPAIPEDLDGRALRRQIRDFLESTKALLESIRARDSFFVCELTNQSDQPAYVFVQTNKSGLYGGSGLVGFILKLAAALFRTTHFSAGR